ncbi:hypothetical protein B0H16DRAFT_1472626 [Mycena metata]|uniref:Uncharacterized protein n=1 Tax=Mycena metata TaxID=1033252 RepID=A0AAD7HMD2_9AGAR|nr:hypothetical protein B0H16DRAFT_1472626 [Mycena metata]
MASHRLPSLYDPSTLRAPIQTLQQYILHVNIPVHQPFGLLNVPNQRDSQYPSDLIQVWECHQFLSTFAKHIKLSTMEGTPTFKYDSVYRRILSGQSALVFVLSAARILPHKMYSILKLFDLSYTVFEPFYAFREHLDVRAFSKGDSPVDFIADPYRAGALYLDLQDTAEVLLLRWFSQAAEVLVGVKFTLDPHVLEIIQHCPPSSRILHGLVGLDLSKLCDQVSAAPEAHHELHKWIAGKDRLSGVLNWLQTLPNPPMEVIEFWKKQITDIRQCIHTNQNESDSGRLALLV